MATAQTRERLMAAVLDTVRELGTGAVSARVIADRAGVSQALVFYHFGSVDNLLAEACQAETSARLASYRDRLGAAGTLRELLAVGRELHSAERAHGNVTILAQLLAASAGNDVLRAATADALRMWAGEIETVLRRVLRAGPFDDLLDPAALAQLVAAAFIGLELFDTVDPDGAQTAITELDRLGQLTEAVESLGPVTRRAVRARLGRAARQ
jgi:AcrR family transcriptional regulator